MKLSFVEKDSAEFEKPSRFKDIFVTMVESGQVLVVENDDIPELEKFQRTLYTMARRYIPKDLKLQTVRKESVLICRLMEKKYRPKTLGQLLELTRKKVVADLRTLNLFQPDVEAQLEDYLAADPQ